MIPKYTKFDTAETPVNLSASTLLKIFLTFFFFIVAFPLSRFGNSSLRNFMVNGNALREVIHVVMS